MTFFFVLFSILFQVPPASAYYSVYQTPSFAPLVKQQHVLPYDEAHSAVRSQVALSQARLEQIPEWKDEQQVMAAFLKVRDERIYRDLQVPNFLRRITWLYREDGCFQRAGHVAARLEGAGFPRVAQFFVFGNITRPWRYHVAPAARVGRQIYILDPALYAHRPLALTEWLASFTTQSPWTPVAICDATTWNPNGDCRLSSYEFKDPQERLNMSQYREKFQMIERRALGSSADSLLGDQPPWSVGPIP